MKMDKKKSLATRVIFAGQHVDPVTGALMTPIFANSTFRQEAPGVHNGMEYGRANNPTRNAFEACVADLEGGVDAFAFASGMAAIDCVLHTLKAGDHVLAMDDLYGGSRRLFEKVYRPQHGLDFTYHDFAANPSVEGLVKPNTKLLWLETPTNPLLKIIDLKAVIASAKKYGLVVAVDNTLCSPVVQRPLEFGADLIVHSVTKYLNGHSDMIGGMVVCRAHGELHEQIAFLYNSVGAVMGPFDAFLAMRGVKTLDVRLQRQMESAVKIAAYLEKHPKVKKVYFPGLASHPQHELAKRQMHGFGAMISIVVDADLDDVKTFLSQMQVFTLAESLGGVESLIEHPGLMTHASVPEDIRQKLGIDDGLVRLSIGIECADDLINDLDQAFKKI
jgi:cystathionine gamma-lyase